MTLPNKSLRCHVTINDSSGCGLRNSEGYLKLFASALLRAKLRPHPEMAGCLVQGLDPRLSTFKG